MYSSVFLNFHLRPVKFLWRPVNRSTFLSLSPLSITYILESNSIFLVKFTKVLLTSNHLFKLKVRMRCTGEELIFSIVFLKFKFFLILLNISPILLLDIYPYDFWSSSMFKDFGNVLFLIIQTEVNLKFKVVFYIGYFSIYSIFISYNLVYIVSSIQVEYLSPDF